jgi:Tfp pilus assembly protein PilV
MSSARPLSAKRRGSEGLSLLEALAATTMLGVALLGLGGNAITLSRASKGADGTIAGNALAQAKIEQLRSLPLGSPAVATGAYQEQATLAADGSIGGPYLRTWVVSNGDVPHWGLKTVTVTVAWTDSRSHATQVAAYVRCSTVPCP